MPGAESDWPGIGHGEAAKAAIALLESTKQDSHSRHGRISPDGRGARLPQVWPVDHTTTASRHLSITAPQTMAAADKQRQITLGQVGARHNASRPGTRACTE